MKNILFHKTILIAASVAAINNVASAKLFDTRAESEARYHSKGIRTSQGSTVYVTGDWNIEQWYGDKTGRCVMAEYTRLDKGMPTTAELNQLLANNQFGQLTWTQYQNDSNGTQWFDGDSLYAKYYWLDMALIKTGRQVKVAALRIATRNQLIASGFMQGPTDNQPATPAAIITNL